MACLTAQDYIDEFWAWRMESSPFYALICGDFSKSGALESWDLNDLQKRHLWAKNFLERLKAFQAQPNDNLTKEENLNIKILMFHLESYIQGADSQGLLFSMGPFDHPVVEVDRMLKNVRLSQESDLESVLMMDLADYRRFLDGGHFSEVPYRFPMFCAYSEGWAMYAESLGQELGLFSDPLNLYGSLLSDLGRSLRLVLDTGINALGWTKAKAAEYFAVNAPSATKEAINKELMRYITYPGQACSYKIGYKKIIELRDKAKFRLGDKFSLSKFHTAVLRSGFVPLQVLEEVVDDFIEISLRTN